METYILHLPFSARKDLQLRVIGGAISRLRGASYGDLIYHLGILLRIPSWNISHDLSQASIFRKPFIKACFWQYYCSFLTTDPLAIQIHYCQVLTTAVQVTRKQRSPNSLEKELWDCTFHFSGRFEWSNSKAAGDLQPVRTRFLGFF